MMPAGILLLIMFLKSDFSQAVCYFGFNDVWFCLCQSLVREPLSKRRALLRESFEEREGEFVFAKSLDSDNTESIAEFLEQSVRGVCEMGTDRHYVES